MNCVSFRDDNTEFRTQWENLYLNWRTGVQLNTYFSQVFRKRLIYVYWFKNLQMFEPGFECLPFIVMRCLLSFNRHIISLKSQTSQGKTTTENLKALNIRFVVVWDSTTVLMNDPGTLNHTTHYFHSFWNTWRNFRANIFCFLYFMLHFLFDFVKLFDFWDMFSTVWLENVSLLTCSYHFNVTAN